MKTLEAKKRDIATSLNTVRQDGGVPAIVYGKGTENLPVTVIEKAVRSLWRDVRDTETFILDVEGTSYNVIMKEIQTNSLTGAVLHIDFHIQD